MLWHLKIVLSIVLQLILAVFVVGRLFIPGENKDSETSEGWQRRLLPDSFTLPGQMNFVPPGTTMLLRELASR